MESERRTFLPSPPLVHSENCREKCAFVSSMLRFKEVCCWFLTFPLHRKHISNIHSPRASVKSYFSDSVCCLCWVLFWGEKCSGITYHTVRGRNMDKACLFMEFWKHLACIYCRFGSGSVLLALLTPLHPWDDSLMPVWKGQYNAKVSNLDF